ncbi:hypothetical protein CPB83DRAFT_290911 [Crepidotus variabilis]|uniref:START domain-containing protein n=1 Tax=Crepidotus variabilis TaxID=179855 RepID=A0A9P6EH44_9AGAR|nr:hypothetical protein CPB83DRAFT_290911 [Crepidotus variabilis]
MSDGSRQSWYSALNEAEVQFRQLLTSSSGDWKRLSSSVDSASSKQKGKTKATSAPELSDVVVHRSSTKGGEEVYRVVLDVPTGDEQVSLEPWKAVLTTPELRQEWDPAVEDAHLVEVFDHITRICKTNYTLGWPANPRDSITISRAFQDASTLIDITTSLPRSSDEPAYLRPSPPFIRSHVFLFAWCIQYSQPLPISPTDTKKSPSGGRIRITCFWQHDLKALWGFGLSTSALIQQLSTMTLSLYKSVLKRGGRVAKLIGYGNGISIERVRYQIDREALTLEYAIIPEDDDHHDFVLQGMDEVHALREQRRLTRSIECVLPMLEGWDVQVTLKGSSDEVESLPWSANAMRSNSTSSTTLPPDQILLRITHAALSDNDAVLKVKIVIEVSGGTRGLRMNGLATPIVDLEERNPTSRSIPQRILQDVASAVDLSFQSSTSSVGAVSMASSTSSQPLLRPPTDRTPAAEKSILSKVRRNYIYFSSLLQEPEAKWRRTTEARGVSITQLDSIDPTLVVYRAEATFVGVNLWDLYAAVVTPGARVFWDKQHDDGVLLEDVNELTELWHYKTKPAWPVTGRDSVVLKTVYKSPTTIHVFCFSADDPHLFPHIPPPDPTVIRTQVDLQGWAIESLSPTTTLLTLLEQSDPKGWTGKTSIPTQMINTLAGIGEFAIKCGGPPFVTRLSGAKADEIKYDHEKGNFKVQYEPSLKRRLNHSSDGTEDGDDGSMPSIELELRCDIDTWGASLDIVVDPPPQTITCLRRHRLSTEGGGLWLTLSHDSIMMDDERMLTLVRRAPGKERGLVMVNGAKVPVDVEELPEQELKALARQKRVKPPRIPLDQPPVMGVIRRRKAEWNGAENSENASPSGSPTSESNGSSNSAWASAPKISSPLSRFWTYAIDQATATTQQAVAAIAPATYAAGTPMLDPSKLPMQYVLEALAWTQEFNSKPQPPDGWMIVNDKALVVQKKLIPEISPYIPVHKVIKVIEGVSAEELASVISEYDCRRKWDEKYDSAQVLESYGGQARTAFLVAKGTFPFRDRGFYVASVVARPFLSISNSSTFSRRNTMDVTDHSPSARNTIFCISASFSPESAKAFAAEKYNPYALPIGRVYLDAWILETLDPYTTENYAIPSTRCTRLVAVDYAGSVPAAFNSTINVTLAKTVLSVEAYMKNYVKASLPITRLPAPGLVISDKRPEEQHGAASSTGSGSGGLSDAGIVVSAPFMAWRLRKRDENRVLIDTRFDVEKVVYKSSVLVQLPSRVSTTTPAVTPGVSAPVISRREASNATVVPGSPKNEIDDPNNVQSNTTTPRHSKAAKSPSPIRRQRELSGQPLPEVPTSASSDSQVYPSTPMHSMPGSIMTPGLPSNATFPSSTSPNGISGLPTPSSGSLPPISGHTSSASLGRSTASALMKSISPPRSSTTFVGFSSSPPPRVRQRAASSGSGTLHYSPPQSFVYPEGIRGRTTSGVFGASAREPKNRMGAAGDLVVMEVVVDSKMFERSDKEKGKEREGKYMYAVDVRARKTRRGAGKEGKTTAITLEGLERTLSTGSTTTTTSGTAASTTASSPTSTSSSTLSSTSEDLDLPFIYTLHTVPSYPLHSSGLSGGPPSRHLLRLTLPTAQYLVGSVWDPLVGKMREGPKKPAWMKILEGEDDEDELEDKKDGVEDSKESGEKQPRDPKGRGIVVDVVVKPWEEKETTGLVRKSSKDGKSMKPPIVLVDGKEVAVMGEKESLSSLGREDLLDDRVGRMGVLSRVPNESEPLPGDLKTPIAVAGDLLLSSTLSAAGLKSSSSLQSQNHSAENGLGKGIGASGSSAVRILSLTFALGVPCGSTKLVLLT